MLLKIERMNHTGEGIATLDGLVFFIPKTIPGDIIDIKEEDIIKHKNYNQVLKYKMIKESDERIPIPCKYYKECGGCHLMGMKYHNQLEYKKQKVRDILNKYANIQTNIDIEETNPYEYRNKITLQVKQGKIGLYTQDSNTLVLIEKCLLIPKELNKIIKILKERLDLSNVNQIILKIMKNKIMIQILGTIKKEETIKELSNAVSSIYLNDDLIYGIPYLKEKLLSHEFFVSPTSFFQINHEGTLKLYNKIKNYLGNNNKNILDLYCGTGTIGIYVSDNCKKITGIELNSSSVEDARRNIILNSINNITILQGDVGKLLKATNTYDAIIVDPPRSGLDRKTKEALLQINSPKIIYVSCNPITLARDINTLKNNYEVKNISLIDMFPNTYHVECVVLLIFKTIKK